MEHKHDEPVPVALEAVVAGLEELETVLGKEIAPAIGAIRGLLIAAMAARDRGDAPGAVTHIGQAMDRLSTLADKLDPAEAVLMRALADRFRSALLRGDTAHAKQSAAVMFEKTGALERGKK